MNSHAKQAESLLRRSRRLRTQAPGFMSSRRQLERAADVALAEAQVHAALASATENVGIRGGVTATAEILSEGALQKARKIEEAKWGKR